MNDTRQLHSPDFFVVKNQDGINALPHWLRRREYTDWRGTLVDKNGKPMVGLRAGADKRGLILCVAQDLLPRVLELVALHRGPDPALMKGL